MKIYEVKFMYWNEGYEDDDEFIGDMKLSVASSTVEEAIKKTKVYVFDNYGYEEEFKYDKELGEDVKLDEPIYRPVTKVEITEVRILAEPDIV